MLAKRGRAAYTGERSIGTLDAGAVGVAVMFERLAEAWPEGVAPAGAAPDISRKGGAVKKFVNDPKDFVPEMLKGIALANPDTRQVRARVQPDHADRRAARRQGLDRPGLRLRS